MFDGEEWVSKHLTKPLLPRQMLLFPSMLTGVYKKDVQPFEIITSYFSERSNIFANVLLNFH